MRSSIKATLLSAAVLLATVVPLRATAIGSGEANVGGTATATASSLTFMNLDQPGPNNGSLAGITAYTNATLTGAPGPVNIVDFATFTTTASGLVHFNLTNLDAGNFSAASPFTVIQQGPNVAVTLSGEGIFYTGTSASGSTPGFVIYTSQVTNTTVAAVIQQA
ncbi:MAG: hypothetical protein JOZ62_16520, partial [Acidobacteriaceae bacterium]|nr:hypothetical protein [Acidobacteriaceae bacterium]